MLLKRDMLPLIFLIFNQVVVQLKAYETYTLDGLDLNRVATMLPTDGLMKFPYAQIGFSWNDEDAATLKWRPQGLSGLTSPGGREFMAVSWYGRDQEGYADRGARIAFVDISEFSAEFMYRHVLLVDENYKTFEGLHAGGLAVSPIDGLLHVPDSRSGNTMVHLFDVNKIQYIPEDERDQFYNYVYVLIRISSYSVPITPSFLSFDWDTSKFITGTFYQCSSYHEDTSECLSSSKNRLAWYFMGEVGLESPSCSAFYSEMQGVAVMSHPTSDDPDERILWTSSSYGSGHDSHIHASVVNSTTCQGNSDSDGLQYTHSSTFVYPPGLEDLYYSGKNGLYSDYLWMHTEFGSNDGSNNARTVFAVKASDLI